MFLIVNSMHVHISTDNTLLKYIKLGNRRSHEALQLLCTDPPERDMVATWSFCGKALSFRLVEHIYFTY